MDVERPLGYLHRQGVATLVDERSARLHGVRHHRRQIDRRLAQVDLAARDPRDVEEVVQQPRLVADLPLHGLARPLHPVRVLGVQAQHAHGAHDGLRSSWASMARKSSL